MWRSSSKPSVRFSRQSRCSGSAVLPGRLLASAGAPPATLAPLLAGELRLGVGLEPRRFGLAAEGDERALAWDSAGAAAALVASGDRSGRLVAVALEDATPGLDLTRQARWADTNRRVDIGDLGGPLDADGLRRWHAFALAAVASDMVGVMEGALRLAVDYAGGREQFGVPIGSFQAIQHLLAEQHVNLEGARSLTVYAAWALEHRSLDEASLAALTAKAYCSEVGKQLCEAVSQVHGGMGMTWECKAQVFLAPDDGRPGIPRRRARPLPRDRHGPEGVGRPWTMTTAPRRRSSACGSGRGWRDNNPGPHPPRNDSAAEHAFNIGWQRSLYAGGWLGLSWPVEYGGRGLNPFYDAILNEELGAAGIAHAAPPVGWLGRAILAAGTEEQRRRHLPSLLNGETSWCQGFSEPGAGSDLASLRTLAQRDGEVYRVTGQKLWTSGAQFADWCLLLARTDRDVPKHKGITAFTVRMDTPGITVRPFKQAWGGTRFCEVFFDGAEVPVGDRLGDEGEGWPLATVVLAYERGPSELGVVATFRAALQRAGPLERRRPRRRDPGGAGLRRRRGPPSAPAREPDAAGARPGSRAGLVGRQAPHDPRRAGVGNAGVRRRRDGRGDGRRLATRPCVTCGRGRLAFMAVRNRCSATSSPNGSWDCRAGERRHGDGRDPVRGPRPGGDHHPQPTRNVSTP